MSTSDPLFDDLHWCWNRLGYSSKQLNQFLSQLSIEKLAGEHSKLRLLTEIYGQGELNKAAEDLKKDPRIISELDKKLNEHYEAIVKVGEVLIEYLYKQEQIRKYAAAPTVTTGAPGPGTQATTSPAPSTPAPAVTPTTYRPPPLPQLPGIWQQYTNPQGGQNLHAPGFSQPFGGASQAPLPSSIQTHLNELNKLREEYEKLGKMSGPGGVVQNQKEIEEKRKELTTRYNRYAAALGPNGPAEMMVRTSQWITTSRQQLDMQRSYLDAAIYQIEGNLQNIPAYYRHNVIRMLNMYRAQRDMIVRAQDGLNRIQNSFNEMNNAFNQYLTAVREGKSDEEINALAENVRNAHKNMVATYQEAVKSVYITTTTTAEPRAKQQRQKGENS